MLQILNGSEWRNNNMRNPLIKRLPREFKSDLGKYLVMFLFMTAAIGFISGFLVAGSSMIKAYNESFDNFIFKNEIFEVQQSAYCHRQNGCRK